MVQNVTAILVAYNSAGVIAGALKALLDQPEIAEIMVVDNCSVDDTCELIRRDFPRVRVIENPRNEGFGRANNVALNRVGTAYALLVNPDAVMQPGSVAALLAAAQREPDAAILAPALYDETGELHVSYKKNVFEREAKLPPPLRGRVGVGGLSQHDHPGRIPPLPTLPRKGGGLGSSPGFLSGAVWLLNMKPMKKIGFFDPNIFLYYEDDDLCLRVRQAGCTLVYVPEAKATHLMGRSSGAPKPEGEFFKQGHMAWSRLYIEKKYRGEKAARRLALRQNIKYSFKAAYYLLRLDRMKLARYRGRLAGIFEFSENPARAPEQ